MPNSYPRFFVLIIALLMAGGCSSYQPTKDVWKTTKGFWNTYVSRTASVDYDDRGNLSPQAAALSKSMIGVDRELSKLERVMHNADKPPTQQWMENLFATFPWLSGFAGIKYNGDILGQYPAGFMKELDFNPLLYEDKKQKSRALRADVQPSPLGAEVMLATPLYDGVDFLGVVTAYFDMRSVMSFSEDANNIVVLCPTALLWSGKYDFAATPLAGVDWSKVCRESSSGSCTNSIGTFYYIVRYLGNLPLVFAIAEKGSFPEGNGNLDQGLAFFPNSREKVAPPPLPERIPTQKDVAFGRSENEEIPIADSQKPMEGGETPPASQAEQAKTAGNEIQPGSKDSMLLKRGGGATRKRVQERRLEGEDVPVERAERRREPQKKEQPIELIPEENRKSLPGGEHLSPFGPAEGAEEQEKVSPPVTPSKPSPFGPETGVKKTPSTSAAVVKPEQKETQSDVKPAEGETTSKEVEKPKADTPKESSGSARLPDGRPSPFGPRD